MLMIRDLCIEKGSLVNYIQGHRAEGAGRPVDVRFARTGVRTETKRL